MTGDFGHRPVVPPIVRAHAPPPDSALLERFGTAFIPDVSDAVGRLYTMDRGIRPLYEPMHRLVGQALTVKAAPGDNLAVHGALAMVRDGDVLVIDWRGTDACATGAGSLALPIRDGLRGAVVDGGWRDIAELEAIGFPVFGRGISAWSPPKARPGEINVPVVCGGVVVTPGDIIVGDREGVAVVPREFAAQVAASLREYEPHRSVDEWDHEMLERARVERLARFEEIVTELGGSIETDAGE
jgi:4-hydroxy-4-methyl-2-oxoglutarate aldolase